MSRIVIIADDLTGAADTAAPFAQAGWDACLLFAQAAASDADVLAVSTESRHLSPRAAGERVAAALKHLPPAQLVYKKIDSTLRGQPAAELAALMTALGVRRSLVAPAFPEQGRTTVRGRQLIAGVPLERTAFAGASDLLELFAMHTDCPVRWLGLNVACQGAAVLDASLEGDGIFVADAETDGDLDALALAALHNGMPLLCGSAGLAGALVHALPARPARAGVAAPVVGPLLVVAGSRNPRTVRQVEAAAATGFAILSPSESCLASGAGCHQIAQAVVASLAAGRHTVLTTAGMADSPGGEECVARTLAHITRLVARHHELGLLVLTGGDIAAAALRSLEATSLRLHGEVQPGIAWGVLTDGLAPGVRVVTKAGGFGGDDAFLQASLLRLLHPAHSA